MASESKAKLSRKQRAFVENYLTLWNASEAARRAGYSQKNANVVGPRLLANVGISEAIESRLADLQMSAKEVIVRLTEQARASMADFVNGKSSTINLSKAEQAGKLHLLKSFSKSTGRTKTVRVELYDAQAALALLGKMHKLFVDRTEITGKDGGDIQVTVTDLQAAESELAAWRKKQTETLSSGPNVSPTPPTSPTPTE